MKINNMENRNYNIDIIKSLAVFFVIAVHFFYNSSFYYETVNNLSMYIMVTMRTVFMMSVPLFLICTGYLMNKKEFSAKYYLGIKKILIPYFFITFVTFIVKILSESYHIFPYQTNIEMWKDFLNFRLIGYAWFVDVYVGLFLLIPFINKVLDKIETDKKLLYILVLLTIFPSTLIFSYWKDFWPFTYYLIGAIVCRYKVCFPIKNLVLLYVLSVGLVTIINIFAVKDISWGLYGMDTWGSFENLITSSLFFLLVINLNLDKVSDKIKNGFTFISQLTLGIYLYSYLVDRLVYFYFNNHVGHMGARLEYFFIVVPIIFISCVVLSKLTYELCKKIEKLPEKIRNSKNY